MKKLLLVGNHIGNPLDLSLRAQEELRNADLIVCETETEFLSLVNDLGITIKSDIVESKNLTDDIKNKIVSLLKNDRSVIFISDAGLPMIADPGIEISQFLFRNGLDIDIVPGPSIVSTAHAVSAIDSFNSNFLFQEFMQYPIESIAPSLALLKPLPHTLVLLDQPIRFIESLEICLDVLGNRDGALAISVTEPHGKVVRGSLSKLLKYSKENNLSNYNLTLIVSGNHSIDWKTLS